MNKTFYKVSILGLLGIGIHTQAQVGVQTNEPKETLHVEGTARVTDLPNSGEGMSYDGADTKNTPFTATKTVVADDKGVLGSLPYVLPAGNQSDTTLKWNQDENKWDAVPAETSTLIEPWNVMASSDKADSNTQKNIPNG